MRRLVYTVLLALAMEALAWTEATGDQERGAVTESSRSRDAGTIIASQWPLRPSSDKVSVFVESLGRRLVRSVQPKQAQTWSFVVVRDVGVKAFTVPSQRVYVSDGAIIGLHTESEFAAVLAHEIGHQQAGHFQETRKPRWSFLSRSLLKPFRENFPSERSQSATGEGPLQQVFSPEKEWEADQHAFRMLQLSGYDPHGLLRVAQTLAQQYPSEFSSWRIQRLTEKLSGMASAGIQNTADFMLIQNVIRQEWSHASKDLGIPPVNGKAFEGFFEKDKIR